MKNEIEQTETKLTPKQEAFVDGILQRKITISSIYRSISKSKKMEKKYSRP